MNIQNSINAHRPQFICEIANFGILKLDQLLELFYLEFKYLDRFSELTYLVVLFLIHLVRIPIIASLHWLFHWDLWDVAELARGAGAMAHWSHTRSNILAHGSHILIVLLHLWHWQLIILLRGSLELLLVSRRSPIASSGTLNPLRFFPLDILIYFIPECKKDLFNSFGDHLNSILDYWGRYLERHLLEYFLIKSVPIIRFLLHAVCVWVIM